MNRIKSSKMIVIALVLVMGVCILSFTGWGAKAGALRAHLGHSVSKSKGEHLTRLSQLNAGVASTATAAVAPLAMLTVNGLSDGTPANDGACTLREALLNANNNDQSGSTDCTAGSGADTIGFSVNGTINLTEELPVITSGLTITGPSAVLLTVRRDTGGDYRVFTINSGQPVNISGLTVSNGKADNGGGILSEGTLTLSNCVITGNTGVIQAGGLSIQSGSAVVTNCTVSDNAAQQGGGVQNNATLALSNSTISGNTATNFSGGGVTNFGPSLTITNTTITNNGNCTVGGLHTFSGQVLLKNTIVAGNHCGASASNIFGTIDATSSFNLIGTGGNGGLTNGVNGNQVGVTNPGLASLGNYGGPTQTHALLPGSPAINAGTNAGAPATDQRGIVRPQQTTVDIGAFESRGFTLVIAGGNNQSAVVNTAFASPLAVMVTANAAGEPVNGGRVTFTPPVSGASSTIAGNPATIASGLATSGTVTANAVTGGPYQVSANASGATAAVNFALTNTPCPTSFTVNSLGDTPDANPDNGICADASGNCTLRAAIQQANALLVCAPLVINFTVTGTINLVTALPDLNHPNLTLNGPGSSHLDVHRNSAAKFRIFTIPAGKTVAIAGLKVSNGDYGTVDVGAGIYNGGTLTLTGCSITDNTTSLDGGGIYNNGTLNLADSSITGNTAGSSGGGIQNSGTLTLSNSTISSNNAPNYGGGIAHFGVMLTVTNSTFSGNHSNEGGGLFTGNAAGAAVLSSSPFTGNSASFGGAITTRSTLTLTDSTLSNNNSSIEGGGLFIDAGANATVNSSTFTGNTAQFGGAIGTRAMLTLTNSTLSGNTGTPRAGGLYSLNSGAATLRNTTVTNNLSCVGGGLSAQQGGAITLQNSLVAGNRCPNNNTANDIAEPVTANSSFNLIGTGGNGGLTNGVNGNQVGVTNPGLASLGNYGGATQTHALLPGSPAINTGNNTGAPATDQRGIVRPQQTTVDIGAFESRGFTLVIAGGNNQSAVVNTAFASPLAVMVTANGAGEPVNGGRVAFTPPVSGASATIAGNPATIASGLATSGTVMANAVTGGPYQVSANASGATAAVNFVLTNTCQTITVNPANSTLPTGRAGTLYNQTFTQMGGIGTVNFSTSAGMLPAGLTLSASGLLSGTPTAFGSFSFTVRATDANNCFGERPYTLLINPPCTTITVNPATLPNGFADAAYNQTLTATGGIAPYTFALTSGSLPNGLTLASGGTLTGTPTIISAGTYNFIVTATDSTGCTGSRSYTLIISGNGLMFYPLAAPVRLLDTRPGASPNACSQPNAPIAGQTSHTQPGRNICTIPANAAALTGNVTTVDSGGGFLTLYPSDAQQPTVASTNYGVNEVINNVFTVGLGADGTFKIFANHTTDVVVDVTGYYAPPGPGGLYFHPLPAPVRLLETRAGLPVGCVKPGTPLVSGQDSLQTATTACTGIPAGARSVVGNATTVGPLGTGYLTLYPGDVGNAPLVASSNYNTGQVVNGPFTVGLSATGQFKIFTTQTTDLVVDVLGYYSTEANDVNGAGLLFNSLPHPVRLLETRPSLPVGCFKPGAPLTGGAETLQTARGLCDGVTIPVNALGVVGNATVVSPAGTGFLTLWPSTATRPLVATSNFNAGDVGNRHFIVGLGNADGAFKIYTHATSHLVVDLSGYFAP
jgi:CSLREA domain-containing protein